MIPVSLIRYTALALLYNITLVVSQAALEPTGITGSAEFVQTGTPELQGANEPQSCGGCYLVADVAGLVWYSEVFINTAATAMVSVGVGNGTRATRTSLIQDAGDFTFNPAATAETGALTQVAFEPTVSVSGAVLRSPTAYNVFTAYSVTSAFLSDGLCFTESGAKTELSSAYSEILPSANGRVFLDANGQQSFIDFLGFTSCSAGGENIVPTALIQVTNTTATMTTTFSGILAAQRASLTVAPSSPSSVSAGPLTSLVFPSAVAPEIVLGNSTQTPGARPIALAIYNGTTVTASTGFVVPGPTGNLSTNLPEPFVGGANNVGKMNGWLVAWIVGLVGFGAGVYFL